MFEALILKPSSSISYNNPSLFLISVSFDLLGTSPQKKTHFCSSSILQLHSTTMAKSPASIGQSIILASILALLSYVPFEYIAKASLLFCAITFINDPFPPYARIISLVGVLIVLLLGKIERKWREGQGLDSVQESPSPSIDGKKKS